MFSDDPSADWLTRTTGRSIRIPRAPAEPVIVSHVQGIRSQFPVAEDKLLWSGVRILGAALTMAPALFWATNCWIACVAPSMID